MTSLPRILLVAGAALALGYATPSAANERKFTYTYESLVLPPGGKELELWVTPRLQRESYYVRFDNRAELELGVTERLMTAFYVNFRSVTKADRSNALSWSLSNEWKYKLLDPVADPVGFAVYGEVTGAPALFEAEAKLIADKRIGNFIAALNLVGEHEWKFGADELEREVILEQDLGLGYQLTPHFSAGLEARNHVVFANGEFEGAALYVGPVVTYASGSWWLAVTFTPQVSGFKPAADDHDPLELHEHERYNGRVLLGFHI